MYCWKRSHLQPLSVQKAYLTCQITGPSFNIDRHNHFNTQFIAIQRRVLRTCGVERGQGSRLDNLRFEEPNWVKHGSHTSAFLESWLLGPFQTFCRPIGTKTRYHPSGHQFSVLPSDEHRYFVLRTLRKVRTDP